MDALDAWEDFTRRTNAQDVIMRYFKQQFAAKPNIQNMLSVGSGECNYEREWVPSSLPNLKHLHLVEPNETLNTMALQEMDKVKGDVQIHNYKCQIEDCHPNTNGLDVMVMINSIYFMLDDLPRLMKEFKLWLAKDGVIYVVFNKSNLHTELGCPIDPDWLCRIMDDAGLSSRVDQLEHTLNVAGIDENNCTWIGLFETTDVEKVRGILKTMRSNKKDEVLIDVYVVSAWQKKE